ncbi:DUF4439 domain-containing protein [Demetria terragena]|uniref:DUF4439 domain-containing protein n=1 Tax=Demetria terragena TaxID=63959 RepID=UPI00036209B0|nr:DUF4439 domain-containing protein [Demetria terragena]
MISNVQGQGEVAASRRIVLAGVLTAPAALLLSGCGVRMERDAPEIPGVRTQGPPDDQALLLATRRSLQHVLDVAERVPASDNRWISPIKDMHRAQLSELSSVMADAGIRLPAPTTATAMATATVGVKELTASEGDYPAIGTEQKAWAASKHNCAMLVSICASRRAAQVLLQPSRTLTHGTAPAATSSLPISRAVRPAVYGFEQIAAKTDPDDRDLVNSTLAWLSGARDALKPVVGEPERPTYVMPVRVTDALSARALARALLTDVITAVASQVDTIAPQGRGAQDWAIRVWALAAADYARWGGPLAAFPGTDS